MAFNMMRVMGLLENPVPKAKTVKVNRLPSSRIRRPNMSANRPKKSKNEPEVRLVAGSHVSRVSISEGRRKHRRIRYTHAEDAVIQVNCAVVMCNSR